MTENSSAAELTDADLKALPDARARAEALGIDWTQLLSARNRLAIGTLLLFAPLVVVVGVLAGLGSVPITTTLGGVSLGILSILIYLLVASILAFALRAQPVLWRQSVAPALGAALQALAWAALILPLATDASWVLAIACGAAVGQIILNFLTQGAIVRLLQRGAKGTIVTVASLREFPAEGTLLGGRVKSMILESAARGILAFSSCVILGAEPLAVVVLVIVIALVEGVANYLAVRGRSLLALTVMIAAAVAFAVAAIILG